MNVYTKSEAWGLMKVSEGTLDGWLRAGKIAYTRIGRKLYFTEDNIREFYEKNQTRGKAPRQKKQAKPVAEAADVKAG